MALPGLWGDILLNWKGAMLKPPKRKSRQRVRRSVEDKACDGVCDEVWELLTAFESCLSMPAAPIHGALHFVAFFVSHFAVYASSQDLFETTLGQPYRDAIGAFIARTIPDTRLVSPFRSRPDQYEIPPQTRKRHYFLVRGVSLR